MCAWGTGGKAGLAFICVTPRLAQLLDVEDGVIQINKCLGLSVQSALTQMGR